VLGAGEEIDHLAFGVGSGIGAAGAPYPNLLPGESEQGFFQFALDGRLADLKLETGIPSAFVFNQKGGPP